MYDKIPNLFNIQLMSSFFIQPVKKIKNAYNIMVIIIQNTVGNSICAKCLKKTDNGKPAAKTDTKGRIIQREKGNLISVTLINLFKLIIELTIFPI